ncbi:MAG: A/G-specific adenine glycosylase [Campylobacterota bacterium]
MFKKAHQKLFVWYQENGRHDLPWRQSSDPYKIWVSEIMLQQTQVKTVLERFYFPFLEKFPSLQVLADAHEDEVLKQWEGLGYYTRARNLHKTAQICQDQLPHSVTELVALPGIGQSTANAVAAFAYKTPVPIMDANVKRVLYRVFGIKKANDKTLWELAYRLFDEEHPFEYNQAMMDIGSLVCQAKQVNCEVCPFSEVCKAMPDDPFLYPEKKIKKKVPIRHRHIVIHEHDNRYALRRRETRFLNGLWGFVEHDEEQKMKRIGEIKHQYSHFHLHAKVYHSASMVEEEVEWYTKEQIRELALSGADHKAFALLENRELESESLPH